MDTPIRQDRSPGTPGPPRRKQVRIGSLMLLIALVSPVLALGAAVARSRNPVVIGLALNLSPFAAPAFLASARVALGPFGPRGRPSSVEDYVRVFFATFLHVFAAEIAAGSAFFSTCSATLIGAAYLPGPSTPQRFYPGFAAGLVAGAATAILVLMKLGALFLRRYRTTTEDGSLSGRRE